MPAFQGHACSATAWEKTAIVTGSTSGIGYAIAKGLAQAGADVIVNGRMAAVVERAVAKLTSEVAHANIRGVAADVGSADGCTALIAAQPSADILVNNVGIYGPQDFFEIPDAAAELPTLRAIAAADLHNLVFQRDYRIVSVITRG